MNRRFVYSSSTPQVMAKRAVKSAGKRQKVVLSHGRRSIVPALRKAFGRHRRLRGGDWDDFLRGVNGAIGTLSNVTQLGNQIGQTFGKYVM